MSYTIHIFAHTHWDREWYFTTSRSKVYLMKEISDVLDTVENENDFTAFLIDGQSSLLDDYLAWRPQDEIRIKNAIHSRKLLVGPWYTQCDQLIISAESVVRNLYYGITRARELGHCMMVGYVPDAFGQGGNMPQIYQSFGIHDAVIVRGVSDDMTKYTNFVWQGSDGSKVLTSQMRTGYSIAEFIPSNLGEADKFWQRVCLENEAPNFVTKHVLFPVGFDQAPIRKELPKIISERKKQDSTNNYVFDTLEDYTQAVRFSDTKLEVVKGELLSGKLRRLHRSIYSSRSDLKAMNTMVQNYVANIMEPLLSLSYILGNDYPHEPVKAVWKLLFENSAHDSIGACVADTVNEDVKMRYKQAKDIATSLVELHSRLISTNIKNTENKFTITLINTAPQFRSGIITKKFYIPGGNFAILDEYGKSLPYTVIKKQDLTSYVKKQTINLDPSRKIYIPEKIYEATIAFESGDVPAFGYVQRQVSLGISGEQPVNLLSKLENEFYSINVNANGSLCIFDKINKHIYDNQAVVIENGDDGDSFNYSPPRQDMVIKSTSFKPKVVLKGSSIIQWANISYRMKVPADLNERSRGIAKTELPITLTIILRKNSHVIDIKIHIDNCVCSHRICILFDSDMDTKFNYADELFGSICRPNRLNQEMDWYLRDLKRGVTWNEKPVAIEPTQSFVGLFNEKRGIGVIPQGVREYEVIDSNGNEDGRGNIIRLTIFRTYSHMGKKNLLYRPGHASGEETIETPDAQLLGPLNFSLGFSTFQTIFDKSNIETITKLYNTPLQAFEYSSFLNGRLMFSEPEITGVKKSKESLFELKGNLVISAVKKAENRKGIIIRLYNAKHAISESAYINFTRPIIYAAYLNLLEEEIGLPERDNNKVKLISIGPSKFVSLYVEVK